MKICKFDNCETKHSASGYCNIHYQRFIRGIPLEGNQKKTIIQRIVEKIDKQDNGCWLWNGAKSGGDGQDKYKYGYMRIKGKSKRVHRVFYEEMFGKIPDGKIALHTCDVPLCVNPNHIVIGTYLDNSSDTITKGRAIHPKGEQNHSKLTEKQVIEILNDNVSNVIDLSIRYNVSRTTILAIKNRKKWKHVAI